MEQWLLNNIGSDAMTIPLWMRICIVLGVILVAYLVDLIFSKCVIPLIQKFASKTKTEWDDILLSKRVCTAFSHILPPIILTAALPFVLHGTLVVIVLRLSYIYIIYNVCMFIAVLMHAIYNIFIYEKESKASSLRGILQTFQIITWIIGVILMISVLLDRSPIYLITGLGAAATVLMLVFQDSIKGLVAGLQLSMNDMVRVGDWICMSNRNVDGVVTEITLSTVKVRNWDNTIMTVQPYTLLTDTFQNWRGMSESAGRRFMRSINVNMLTVRLLTAEETETYKKNGWLSAKAQCGLATNLEAFRGYMHKHLKEMSEINDQMTLMVRQLPVTSEGIPVQVYGFTHTKEWEAIEEIQCRIVEHMLVMLPQFDMLPYQRSSDKASQ